MKKIICPKCGHKFQELSLGEQLAKEIEIILKETNEKMFYDDIYNALIKKNSKWKKVSFHKFCGLLSVIKGSNNIEFDYALGNSRTGKSRNYKPILWYERLGDR